MIRGQAALPLPPVEPDVEALREAFDDLPKSGQRYFGLSFDAVLADPTLRLCLRNLAEARARAQHGVKR